MENFTPKRENLKGLIVAKAPTSSQYANQDVIVGFYLDFMKDVKSYFFKGKQVYPSALFGPENKNKIYLKRLMNVEYKPIEEIKEINFFGCPLMKTSKSGTHGVKCTLSIRKSDLYDLDDMHRNTKKIVDELYNYGFTNNTYVNNNKVTFIEAEYYNYYIECIQ